MEQDTSDLGVGSKGRIYFNFNYKFNFTGFIPNLVCSHKIQDIKYIKRDFHSVDFGELGVKRCGISFT